MLLLLLVPGSLLLPLVARLLPLLLLCSGFLLDLSDRCCEGGGKVVMAIFLYRDQFVVLRSFVFGHYTR